MKELPEDYGCMNIVQVRDGYTFTVLMDELQKEYKDNIDNGKDEGFWKNRAWLYNASKNELVYTIFIEETPETKVEDEIFCKNDFEVRLLLPTFCVVYPSFSDTECGFHVSMIWTAKRARGYGFASYFLDVLNVEYVDNPIPSAEGFWKQHPEIKKSQTSDSRYWKTDNDVSMD